MNILLAPDKFKGVLSAEKVCELMEQGIRSVLPEADIDSCPIADGGDGFADVLRLALGGRWVSCKATDAMGRPMLARYVLCGETAIMEMSAASGIRHIPVHMRDVWRANTLGTGEMIRDATENHEVRRIIIGIGGSASNDAGCGMLAALGVRFLDRDGMLLDPTPKGLTQCVSIDRSQEIDLPEIQVACDVDNPLLGPHGAVQVYAPQKVASEGDLEALESFLERVVDLINGGEASLAPGAGAAGGLGFGLLQFCGASLTPGFDLIAKEVGLPDKVSVSDVVITGEGRLDDQTLRGKGPAGVAQMAKEMGKKTAVIAGIVDLTSNEATALFDYVCQLHEPTRSLEQTIEQGESLLIEKAAELAVVLKRESELL